MKSIALFKLIIFSIVIVVGQQAWNVETDGLESRVVTGVKCLGIAVDDMLRVTPGAILNAANVIRHSSERGAGYGVELPDSVESVDNSCTRRIADRL